MKTNRLSIYLSRGVALLLFMISLNATGQRNVEDSIIGATWVSVNYGINWTEGDLAERFGVLHHLGVFAGYKTKRNWVYGVEGNFIFGNQIRVTNLFDHLTDSYGTITDQNGDIALVQVLARGFNVNASVGKIFPVFGPNDNSGIYVSGGAGYLAHKLRIETQDHVVPQIELDYRKGYDKLTSGINTHQFLGYALMANQGVVNFYAGFYVQEGFTYNRRTVFFEDPDTPVPTDMRIDIQYGFKFGWLIPIYKRMPKEYYYD